MPALAATISRFRLRLYRQDDEDGEVDSSNLVSLKSPYGFAHFYFYNPKNLRNHSIYRSLRSNCTRKLDISPFMEFTSAIRDVLNEYLQIDVKLLMMLLKLSSQKGSRVGRGVKEKNLYRNKTNSALGIGVSTKSDDTMNEDTPIGVESAIKEGVTPSVVDMTVEMEKQSSLENTTVLGSFPPLSTLVTSLAGNAPGKSSYANVTSKASGKRVNFHTLFTPGGNGIDVVVPVESIRAISEQFANTAYGFFLGEAGLFSFQFSSMDGLDAMFENGPWFIRNNPLILKKWHPDVILLKEDVSTVPVWVKLHGVPVTTFSKDGLSAIATKLADMELKDNIVVAMPKITREGHYTCNIRVEYEWKPLRIVKLIKGILVGSKVGFKPTKEYRLVPKKHTANSSGIKKKDADPTNTVSDSNPFEVLNSVNNDVEMGTNGGTSNLDKNGANSSESSFWNVKNSSTIIDGKAILVDEVGNPLKKIEYLGDHDSEDEVASVDNDMTRDLASERTGFGTQSLLEQWRDSYGNGDYDDDPYDDDMYEGHDLSEEIQTICDKLDIRVRGRKK
ncbi:retrotransposon protein, putative, ty1-copia subclass [Tanacetum coccineum]